MVRFVVVILAATVYFAMMLFYSAFAQQPQGPQLSPEVQQLVQQIHAVGCQAEEIGAAQTIDQLRKENASLKAQLQKLDPPKSGATKH